MTGKTEGAAFHLDNVGFGKRPATIIIRTGLPWQRRQYRE